MNKAAKLFFCILVAAIVWPARISVAQAIPITKGSYELEPRNSAPSVTGVEHNPTRIIGLDNGPESLLINEELTHCDLDPQSCGAMTVPHGEKTADTITANDARTSMGQTAGGMMEFSEPTALLLLILGLFGLSRLRGKPMD